VHVVKDEGDALCTRPPVTRPMLRGAGECGGALDLRCGAVRLFVRELFTPYGTKLSNGYDPCGHVDDAPRPAGRAGRTGSRNRPRRAEPEAAGSARDPVRVRRGCVLGCGRSRPSRVVPHRPARISAQRRRNYKWDRVSLSRRRLCSSHGPATRHPRMHPRFLAAAHLSASLHPRGNPPECLICSLGLLYVSPRPPHVQSMVNGRLSAAILL
jgi:hypothetical protein